MRKVRANLLREQECISTSPESGSNASGSSCRDNSHSCSTQWNGTKIHFLMKRAHKRINKCELCCSLPSAGSAAPINCSGNTLRDVTNTYGTPKFLTVTVTLAGTQSEHSQQAQTGDGALKTAPTFVSVAEAGAQMEAANPIIVAEAGAQMEAANPIIDAGAGSKYKHQQQSQQQQRGKQ
jgi:hypothetical protein